MAKASASFRKNTSQTFDGLHVCHWHHLSEEALEITAHLFCLTIALGMLPSQIRAVVATAIPKATTGYRTIGLFPAYYRLLVRTASPMLKEWEEAHPNRIFSFSAGRSAVLTVWAQAAQQEVTSAIGKPSCATVLWDLSDFYEGMDRGILIDRAVAQQFPVELTFLSLSAYSGERIISLNGVAVTAGHPTRGVIAGCGIATYHVQVYHGPPMRDFVNHFTHLDLNIHIDDLALSAAGHNDTEVVEAISEGAAALHNIVEQELKCKVSVPKADLVASSPTLRKRIGRVLGELGAKWHTTAAVNLGIDIVGGMPRRANKNKKLGERLHNQKQRKHRIRRFARACRKGAQKVFSQGVLPAVEYGTQIWGYSNKEVQELQTLFLAAAAPPGKGKSRSTSLLLLEDVAWRPATAPISTYATAVWLAITAPETAPVKLDKIAQWHKVESRKVEPRNWGDVCGPFSAMNLSLRRIGWKQISFATFRDHEGMHHNVADIGPKMFVSKLRSAWRYRTAQQAAKSRIATIVKAAPVGSRLTPANPHRAAHNSPTLPGDSGELGETGADSGEEAVDISCYIGVPAINTTSSSSSQWVDAREKCGSNTNNEHEEQQKAAVKEGKLTLDLYHVTSLINKKERGQPLLEPLQQSCMQNFVVGGVWTRSRLYEAGYDVDILCPLCQQAPDTIDHRLFHCSCSQEARDKLKWGKGEGSWEEAKEHWMAKQGLAFDPSWQQPKPAESGNYNIVYEEGGPSGEQVAAGEPPQGNFEEAFAQCRYLFTDGGCTKTWHPKLNRATWVVVAGTEDGRHLAACTGPVWANLPQTSPAGEYCAMAAACQLAKGIAKHLIADFIAVVKVINRAGCHLRAAKPKGIIQAF